MKKIICFAVSTILLLPAVAGILSDSTMFEFLGILYAVWLGFQSGSKYGKILTRNSVRLIIDAEKALGIW
jgi:hypothetical protein